MKELFIMAVIVLAGISASAQKTTITLKDLPTAAQSFVASHFKDASPSHIVKDQEIMDTEYKIIFNGGLTIEFDSEGNWEEISGNGTALPQDVLPKAITGYLDTHYKSQGVIKIEKDNKGYDIELANGFELEFDSQGKFRKMDN